MNAVRKLATKAKTRTDRGEPCPYVYVEIKEFLPAFCPEVVAVVLEDNPAFDNQAGVTPCAQAQRAIGRRPELHIWEMGWDAYALAAAVVRQFSFAKSRLHKRFVTRVAVTAHASGFTPLLGVLYDEVAR